MKNYQTLRTCVFVLLLIVCSRSVFADDYVTIEASVVFFKAKGYRVETDDFISVKDVSVLKVITPNQFENKTLVVAHNSPPSANSAWTIKDSVVEFKLHTSAILLWNKLQSDSFVIPTPQSFKEISLGG